MGAPSGKPAILVGETISGFRIVRELNARAMPTYVARKDGESSPELVILQRFQSSDRASALLRCAADVDHPNVLRIRSYDIAADEVLVIGDLIDGEMLAQICPSASEEAPLELMLRIFVDTLTGLQALHDARDSTGRPLKLVHGQLARDEIFVGLDGVARVTNVAKTSVRRDARYVGYLAPEVLSGDDPPDLRADLYSVGVHLWEALARKRLFDGTVAGQVLAQQVNTPIPRPQVSQEMLWAVPLVELALKALSPDRTHRFASAAEMSEAIVRAAGAGKIGENSAVGALVESLVGSKVRDRREQLSVPLARSPSSSTVRR